MSKSTTTNSTAGAVRHSLALEASHQVAALSELALLELNRINVAGDDGVRAALIRIHDLSLATMSAMGDEEHDEAELTEAVHGRVAANLLRRAQA
jgi:hypothetical protein